MFGIIEDWSTKLEILDGMCILVLGYGVEFTDIEKSIMFSSAASHPPRDQHVKIAAIPVGTIITTMPDLTTLK